MGTRDARQTGEGTKSRQQICGLWWIERENSVHSPRALILGFKPARLVVVVVVVVVIVVIVVINVIIVIIVIVFAPANVRGVCSEGSPSEW